MRRQTHEEHGESLAEDSVEEVLGVLPRDDEEVLEEEELSTTVVEKRELLRAEDHLERVLQVRKTLKRHHKLTRKE